jgi:nitroreductase
MNEALQQLFSRNSAPRLIEPGPDEAALRNMFTAALRAPDHAWLQPWRFLVIRGGGRQQLGQVFLQSLLARDPGADEAARSKAQNAPQRAPLMVVVICRYTQHPKVPEQEQLLSAGCAAHGLLLAAEAQDYAGVWRTGSYAEDPTVASALGLAANETIVGFLYFGSRDGAAKKLPARKVEDYVSNWPA